jgi:hypothetical protein
VIPHVCQQVLKLFWDQKQDFKAKNWDFIWADIWRKSFRKFCLNFGRNHCFYAQKN